MKNTSIKKRVTEENKQKYTCWKVTNLLEDIFKLTFRNYEKVCRYTKELLRKQGDET